MSDPQTSPVPLFDPNRTNIKNSEAWNYLTDISGGGIDLAKLLNGNSNYPKNIATRTINKRYTSKPDDPISIRSYDLQSITYNGVQYAIPKIEVIGFSSGDISRYDTAIALIKYASINNINIPELSNSLSVLNSLLAKGYKSIAIFDAGASTSSGAGGQANIEEPGKPLWDSELEAFVNSGGSGGIEQARNMAALFHETSHGFFGPHLFSASANGVNPSTWDELLASVTVARVANEESYKAGYEFALALAKIAGVIKTDSSPGDKFTVQGTEYDAGSIKFSESDIKTAYNDPKNGLIPLAAEQYENLRISVVNIYLKQTFSNLSRMNNSSNTPAQLAGLVTEGLLKLKPKPSGLTADQDAAWGKSLSDYDKKLPTISETQINEFARQGFLKLKPMPTGLTADQVAAWGKSLENYDQVNPGYVDLNGDGVKDDSRVASSVSSKAPIVAAGAAHTLWADVKKFVSLVEYGVSNVDGGQIGLALGSVLGKRLTSDPFGQIVASGTLSTLLGAVGEYIDENIVYGASSANLLGHGVEGLGIDT